MSEREAGERGEREGERIPSRLHVISAEPDVELDPTDCEIVTCVEVKSRMLNQLSPAQVPHHFPFISMVTEA